MLTCIRDGLMQASQQCSHQSAAGTGRPVHHRRRQQPSGPQIQWVHLHLYDAEPGLDDGPCSLHGCLMRRLAIKKLMQCILTICGADQLHLPSWTSGTCLDAGKPLVEPQEDMPLTYMGEKVPYDELAGHIQGVPGVLAHGLLLGIVSEAVVATEKGPQTVRRVDVSA